MIKRVLSAVLLAAVLAGTTLTSVGCSDEPDVYVEEHEEVNTTEVKESNLRVD